MRSELSPPRLIGANFLSEHIPSQFAFQCCVRLVSLLLSFHAPTPEKVKKLQDLVYTAVEISYSVALCTRCNFVFDICPAYSPIVTKQLLSTLDLASIMVSLLHLH